MSGIISDRDASNGTGGELASRFTASLALHSGDYRSADDPNPDVPWDVYDGHTDDHDMDSDTMQLRV